MSETTWAALGDEYARETVGELWLDEVSRAVRTVAPKYPPSVYTETGAWGADEFENLVQDVVVHHLLEDGQLAYIVDTATDISAARALIHRTVARSLARGRRRTIVDNLLERCRALQSFVPAADASPAASDVQLRAAAAEVAKLPRIRIINSDRAPAVFSGTTLASVVGVVREVLGPNVRERELARIFELVLADYVPSGLVQTGGGPDEPDRALTPEEEVTVMDTLRQLAAGPQGDLQVLALKITDESDTVVARHLGVSRPTAAKRFKEASAAVQHVIGDIPARLQDEVLSRFSDQLLREHLPPIERRGGTDDRE
jgi:hypothetical protein